MDTKNHTERTPKLNTSSGKQRALRYVAPVGILLFTLVMMSQWGWTGPLQRHFGVQPSSAKIVSPAADPSALKAPVAAASTKSLGNAALKRAAVSGKSIAATESGAARRGFTVVSGVDITISETCVAVGTGLLDVTVTMSGTLGMDGANPAHPLRPLVTLTKDDGSGPAPYLTPFNLGPGESYNFSVSPVAAGEFTYEASSSGYSDDAELRVVEIDEVESSAPIVAVGDNVTFTATPNPAGVWPAGWPKLYVDGVLQEDESDEDIRAFENAGEHTVKFVCGTSEKQVTVTVVAVDHVTADPTTVAIGEYTTFTAYPAPNGDWPPFEPTWTSNGEDENEDSFGSGVDSVSVRFTTAGQGWVKFECGDSEYTAYVNVVAVDEITGEELVPIGVGQYYSVSSVGSGGTGWPAGEPEYQIDGGGWTYGDSFYHVFTEEGYHTVEFRCGTSTVDMDVTVVKVESVDTAKDVVPIGEEITFTAVPDPTSPWPDGEPNWTAPTGSPAAGDTGSAAITFDTPGTHSVTFTCGTSSETKYIRVVEVESATSTVARVPVGVDVTFTATPNALGTWPVGSEWPALEPEYTVDGGTASVGHEFTRSFSTAGEHTVEFTCGTSTETITVTAVEIDSVTADYSPAATGESVTFTAIPSPTGDWPVDTPTWTTDGLNAASEDEGTGHQVDIYFATPGTHSVTFTCGSSVVTKTVEIVEVLEIEYNLGEGFEPIPETGLRVAVGSVVQFRAMPNEPGAEWPQQPTVRPVWSGLATGTGSTTEVTFTTVSTTDGDQEVSATCGNTVTEGITVVEVEKLQYKDAADTWQDVPDPMYVPKGKTVEFRALPNPEGAWPDDKPVWSGDSGASGTGVAEVSVAFANLSTLANDFKTVRATCGASYKEANVIVWRAELLDIKRVETADSEYKASAVILAGAKNLANHKADLRVQVSPAISGITLPEPVKATPATDLDGYAPGVGAGVISMSNLVTNSAGQVLGTYTSSDITKVVKLTLTTGQSGAPLAVSIDQHWDDLVSNEPDPDHPEKPKLWSYEKYFWYGFADPITFTPKFSDDGGDTYFPTTGHNIRFESSTALVGVWNGSYYNPETYYCDAAGNIVSQFIPGKKLAEFDTPQPKTDSNNGVYTSDQTINWDDDEIVAEVQLRAVDTETYK